MPKKHPLVLSGDVDLAALGREIASRMKDPEVGVAIEADEDGERSLVVVKNGEVVDVTATTISGAQKAYRRPPRREEKVADLRTRVESATTVATLREAMIELLDVVEAP